ncbi:MAG: class I SAM-dependent methyltransferase [Candidatus Kariarchaeaceae archaeon]|jgi:ubiquinone/menaquinone biosynthesis C-methylase UbiE
MIRRRVRVDENARQTPHEDYYYDFSKQSVVQTKSRIRRNEIICNQIENEALVIGCGEGFFLQFLETNLKLVIGVDLSEVRLRRAITRFKGHIVCADAYYLPFRDSFVHCVIASELLEHLTKPYDAIIEFTRVLSKRGKLIVSTPNGLNPIHFFKGIRNKDHIETAAHHFIFTPYCLELMLQKCGYRIDKVKGSGFGIPTSRKLPIPIQLMLGEIISKKIPRLSSNIIITARKLLAS